WADDGVVEDEQQEQPEDLDGQLGEEVGAEGHFTEQPEAGERLQEPQVAPDAPPDRLARFACLAHPSSSEWASILAAARSYTSPKRQRGDHTSPKRQRGDRAE